MTTYTVANGQTQSGVTLGNGDELVIDAGGTATGTTVNSGSLEYVAGTATDTAVNSGGDVLVVPSGSAGGNTTVNFSGRLEVSGGTVAGVVVNTGGSLILSGGPGGTGKATGTTVHGLGASPGASAPGDGLTVNSGATAADTSLDQGGYAYVDAGGTVSGTTTLSGGAELRLGAGAVADGTIAFGAGGGSLYVAGTTAPNATLTGFGPGDAIVLSGQFFGASETVGVSGDTVTVRAGGGATYAFTIAGAQALASAPHTAFALSGDDFNTQTVLALDTVAPTVSSVRAYPDVPGPSPVVAAGRRITFTLGVSKALTVNTAAGAPSLALSNGASAAYDATASTSTGLVFHYTVAAGQDTADLKAVGLSLNGASAVDFGGLALDASGLASLAGSDTGLAIDTTPPAAPTALTLSSDSGAVGDGITNVFEPTITGAAEPGSTVTLRDGTVAVGTTTAPVGASGTWSIWSAIGEGPHSLTATATDAAGNVSAASAPLSVTVDTTRPAVTVAVADNPAGAASPGLNYAKLLTGGGDPSATVTIYEGSAAVGTAQAGASGAWTFDPSNLGAGVHALSASETDAAGNTGTSPVVAVNVPDAPFSVQDVSTGSSGTGTGSSYAGPVSYLRSEYDYTGSENVNVTARSPDVFIKSGSGEDALQAIGGSNVLDGGTGSNFLVGASGADGGTDTFFTDARDNTTVWNTLVNFHAGDSATLWGFDPSVSTWRWDGVSGAGSYQGATLRADVHGTGTTDASITFAGLSMAQAQGLQVVAGSIGGLGFLYFHNPGV